MNTTTKTITAAAAAALRTADVMQRIPTVARLYYTGIAPRRYRRASTMNGPGEPLVHRSHVERELQLLGGQVKQADERGDEAMRRAHAAEAEVERLRALNEQLLKALRDDACMLIRARGYTMEGTASERILAAIAAAEGQPAAATAAPREPLADLLQRIVSNANGDPSTGYLNVPAANISAARAALAAATAAQPADEDGLLLRLAVEHQLQILTPDGEPTAVARNYPETVRAGVDVVQGGLAGRLDATRSAIRKALQQLGIEVPAPAAPAAGATGGGNG